MPELRDDPAALPSDHKLFEVSGDGNALRRYLEIQPPDPASKVPPLLAFTRKREVEIPWDDILSDEAAPGAAATLAIRRYFEASWGLGDGQQWWEDPSHHLLDDGSGAWFVKQLKVEQAPAVYRPDFGAPDPQGRPKPVLIADGYVIRHGTSGRLYRIIPVPDARPLADTDFQTRQAYEAAWEELIDGVELVFESELEAQTYFMDYEEVDLQPALIQRRYEELRIALDFATRVSKQVTDVTNAMISQITTTTLGVDELEQLQRKILRLQIGQYDAQSRLERLATDAARLGYRLVIGAPEVITLPDKTTRTLESGKLYTTYKRTARWTEYVTRQVPAQKGWWIFKKPTTKAVQVPCPQESVLEDYQAVDTSKDMLAEKRSELLKQGFQVYIFEQTPAGLASTEGVLLRQIMKRGEYDETFRRKCAVMLPVYEDSLTGQRLVVKYVVYKRPLPGLVPTILPRLSLQESLAYRTAWVQTQLGELLNSINLAPSEQRTVTITKRFEQETTVTRTSTSVFEIGRAESSDLASEMENQTRREQELSANMQFSTKASGGYGPFSAEASASGGVSSSLKNMSQAISKVARKAAKSVSSQNREEVSSATSARTTITNSDETVATIQNINQGRSLNLMFYRLYNRYEGGLFLENLSFDVISSIEIIAGSGVYESKSYDLDDLQRMVAEFQAGQLPFGVKDESKYTQRLVQCIDNLLCAEYSVVDWEKTESGSFAAAQETKGAGSVAPPALSSRSVQRLSFGPPVLHFGQQQGEEDVADYLRRFGEQLRQAVIHSDEPIAPQELLVAAPGLYLDAAVGLQPGTEPYSEQMRTQEVRMRAAEASVKESESAYQLAMARRLTQLPGGNGANCLVGVLPAPDRSKLTLATKLPLPPGDWHLMLGKDELAAVDTSYTFKNILTFSWDEPQEWLKDENLLSRTKLVDSGSKEVIAYPT